MMAYRFRELWTRDEPITCRRAVLRVLLAMSLERLEQVEDAAEFDRDAQLVEWVRQARVIRLAWRVDQDARRLFG